MDYPTLKKLDEESGRKLQEGTGPIDECLCSVLSPPIEEHAGGIRKSIKRAFSSLRNVGARKASIFPTSFRQGKQGVHTTTKQVIPRTHPCKNDSCKTCGQHLVMKHSYASIRVSAPDVSNICSCHSGCLQDRLQNSIKVTVERAELDSRSGFVASTASKDNGSVNLKPTDQ